MVTDSHRTSNGCLCPFCPVESFEHVQNFPPYGMDINRHHRTRNGFTGLETDIKRIRTDTNGLNKVLSVTHPLARCDRNLKMLAKNVKFIKFVFISFLNLEILLSFSVKVLHLTETTRIQNTTKACICGNYLKLIV